jgi:hypothetical protein
MADTFAPADTVETPTEATAPAIDLSASPWLSRDAKGNWIGKGAELPETVPGSPEYEVTKTDRLRNEHAWLFDAAKNVGFYNEDASQAIFGIPASKLSADGVGRAKQIEDAAWGVLKVKRPEAEWNAGLITSKLVPYATVQRDAEILRGVKYPAAYGMQDDQLQEFVINPSNGVHPDVASEVLRELASPGYLEQKQKIGTSLVQRIRKSLALVDNQLVIGKTLDLSLIHISEPTRPCH